MRAPSPLTVEFRDAHTDLTFASRYLTEVLRPGIEHPKERRCLYNADHQFFSAVGAIIGVGWVGDQIAVGLYITIDDVGTAWINGVRVREHFRRLGYASAMVKEALAYIADYLGIHRCALTVFCDENGVPNKAAFDTYSECGFRQVKSYPVTVAGSLRDRHLGAAGTEILAIRMDVWSRTCISGSRNQEHLMSETTCARQDESLPTPDDILAWTLATLVILDNDDREFLRDAMTLYGDLRVRAMTESGGE